jgi:hypothetical protein
MTNTPILVDHDDLFGDGRDAKEHDQQSKVRHRSNLSPKCDRGGRLLRAALPV